MRRLILIAALLTASAFAVAGPHYDAPEGGGGGGGTPGGIDTQVQYNDSGAFGGESAFTYSAGSDQLTTGKMLATGGWTLIRSTPGAVGDSPAMLGLQTSRGTAGSETYSLNDDWISRLGFIGYRDAFGFAEGARINAYARSNWVGTNHADLVLLTAGTFVSGGSSNTPQPRLKISYTGKIGIGDFTVSTAPAQTPDELLHVRYDWDGQTGIKIDNATGGTSVQTELELTSNSGSLWLRNQATGNNAAIFGGIMRSSISTDTTTGLGVGTTASAPLTLGTNNAARVVVSGGGEVTVNSVSGDGTGKAVCIKSDGTLGTCTDAPNGSGVCTCT